MAFYAIDRIRENNLDFLYDITSLDKKELANSIRKNDEKDLLIKNSYKNGLIRHSYFYFMIVYDMDEFEEFTKKYIKNNNFKCLNDVKISNLIKNTKYGMEFIFNNIDKFCNNDKILNLIIFNILINDKEYYKYINILSLHPNLHLRHLFIKNLISFNSALIPQVYDDITLYFTSYTHQENEQLTFLPKLMDIDNIQEILEKMIKNGVDIEIIKKTRDFILNNYKANDLANILYKEDISLIEVPDLYFNTSRKNKIHIYRNLKEVISKDIKEQFEKFLQMYSLDIVTFDYFTHKFRNLDYFGLLNILNEFTEKYMDLSTNKAYREVGSGSTTSSYRIGDYCIKLSNSKWSYENVICPNDFMFAKNFEEIIIRDEKTNFVNAAIEVQQFFCKSVKEASENAKNNLLKSISDKDLFFDEKLISCNGANAFLLNDYHDADCANIEHLPDWFKKEPLVITDRDNIYVKDAKNIKKRGYN